MLTYGARLQAVRVPADDGSPVDVALGLPTLDDYVADDAYLGAVVGRYANRIAHGRFTLDGASFTLPRNDGPHTLHGGPEGFHRRVWSGEGFADANREGVRMSLRSPDGDMGFPGNLDVTVTYSVDRHGTVTVDYHATTDAPTVVNLSQHVYWNLAGTGSVDGHLLTVHADQYLPVDPAGLPLTDPRPVTGTAFALDAPLGPARRSSETQIARRGGLDHCYLLRGGATREPRPAAVLTEPASGLRLETWTTEPGLQVYTANTLAKPFGPWAAVCLETQNYPDGPNRTWTPRPVLRPGGVYRSRTEYRFTATTTGKPA
ncbi:galactose mutarotase [Yinghuangia aomiensis]|uniref:Galactose mutarotase n=1 Tax=Yinghuangia aomiensis TaxID=676205 RepID=A0ABP9I917_9ACTN